MIGIDLVAISRIEKMMERFGNKALERFLSKDEIALVQKPSRAAGFWAAKEAASKALKTGIGKECSFHDIILTKASNGAPHIEFSKKIIDNFKISDASVSITHDNGMAIAVVAIEKHIK